MRGDKTDFVPTFPGQIPIRSDLAKGELRAAVGCWSVFEWLVLGVFWGPRPPWTR